MSRLRTFIAVELAKPVRDRLISLQESLARTGAQIKWVEPENLHVTLLFLGEVEDRKIPQLCKMVADTVRELPGFTLTVASVGCFGNPRRPRTIWVGVGEGSQPLCALHDTLEARLEGLGYRREDRRYTPHITLGRAKGEGPSDRLAPELAKKAGWKGGETAVEEIHVMSSELTSRGPRYTVLARPRLEGPAAPPAPAGEKA